MITIKIQCGCGQRYAFDVEPFHGRMPSPVACPVCNTDGTTAANTYIDQALSRSVAAQPVMVAEPAMAGAMAGSQLSFTPPPERVVHANSPAASEPVLAAPVLHAAPAVAATPPKRGRLPGQLDRTQAECEARAKCSWGDSQEEVTKFLMIQGFTVAEAKPLITEMFTARAATIRSNGIKKAIMGFVLACVPVAAWFYFAHLRILPVKLFAATVMVGLYGAYCVLKGTIMFVAPKSEPGDVAEQ